ncbi:DUF3301 domain-containing protein [Gayadomonas joobiniege]|uniref:DUF3301 domain-containing protein n=1 Tax=Gayadomonas joobiniege TaxID=1234606 RepID=UPI000379D369|nr:DUF3301 domain-containing protein [Gayadomonas joobiniege]
MVQLTDLIVLISIALVIFQFWQLRRQSEAALAYAKDYCERNNIQFISVARQKTRMVFFKKQLLEWHSKFQFEFSGNGEDSNFGELVLIDQRLINVTTEVYKMN